MYIKYKLQKKQVSHDGGVTWVDVVPLEERVGESAGTYSTLEECEEIDYSTQYLTIESLEDGNIIYWYGGNSGFTRTISASTDNGQTWTAYTATSGGTQMVTLNTGDKVFIKGLNDIYFPEVYSSFSNIEGCRFNSSKRHIVYGNIMSLVDGDNFIGSTSMASRSFRFLFFNNRMLVSAENLVLPATTLSQYCYNGMFASCRSLTTAPELPATTLASNCYMYMFHGTSLTVAPELPATTLADGCYGLMFTNCTSLTTAPELPATILAEGCYNNMFNSCTSLTTAPVLPATTLVISCYQYMFWGCSNLNHVKCLATYIPANSTFYWVGSVASSGTFVKAASMNDWTTGDSGIPNNWTVQNA